jgi:hypothetical protein
MPAGGVNGVGFAVMFFAPAQRRDGEISSEDAKALLDELAFGPAD